MVAGHGLHVARVARVLGPVGRIDRVGDLRAGRNPHDRELSDLVEELATQSDEFRALRAAHDVRLHTKGVKQFNHPIVGELQLSFNRLDVRADPGLTIVAYTAEPGSRAAEAFRLLASWAATEEAAEDSISGAGMDRAWTQVAVAVLSATG